MLKINRKNQTLNRLDAVTLKDAHILERTDLQEYIFNSSDDFFAEIGERVFLVGKEVTPSQTVQDRIDLLGIDSEGNSVIVELKRGSNKLQMLQAVSYAGMIARWSIEDFRRLITNDVWEQLIDFLDVDIEEINRRQRLLLVAEAYDYALLAGAEWLSEHHGVDIRCSSISLATDQATQMEYLACTSIFPPPELAEQATARSRSSSTTTPIKWNNWKEALAEIENEALRVFAREEINNGRNLYLRRRRLTYRVNGKRRWNLNCRNKHGYVWQRGRFADDISFWQDRLSVPESVKTVKNGRALSLRLLTEEDLRIFREAVTIDLISHEWFKSAADKADSVDDPDLI